MTVDSRGDLTDVHADARTDFHADVLVVGAGPVGLTLAAALAHHGVGVDVVDRRSEPRSDSRANNLWSRPQELLDTIGVRDALAEGAARVNRAEFLLDRRPLHRVELAGVDSPFPHVLYSSQAAIERQLRRVLFTRGVQVRGETLFEGLRQDDDQVEVTLRGGGDTGDGAVETRRYRYVVGTDGAASAVRGSVGIDMPTEDLPGRAVRQIDAKLRWRRPLDREAVWFFAYRDGFAGVMPVEGEYHRLFFLEDDAVVPEREPTLEEMTDRAREVTGDVALTLTDPIWLSHTRFSHGVADAHAAGRVLLAGDAGHLNLPIGGQGMNAGITDAVGLAWRLAMTLDGRAAPVVLGSYASERNAEHRKLGQAQVKGFRRLMYRKPWQDTALRWAADVLPDLGIELFGTQEMQQLTVAYPDSALSEDHLASVLTRRAPRAGDRIPRATLTGATGTTTTTTEVANPDGYTWGWTLLTLDGADTGRHPDLDRAVTAVRGHDWIRPRHVLADPHSDEHARNAPVLFDLDRYTHDALGLDDGGLVLVRPDGHIAFRGATGATEGLTAYCAAITRPDPDRKPAAVKRDENTSFRRPHPSVADTPLDF